MDLNHECVRDVLLWVEKNVPTLAAVYTDDLIEGLSDKWDQNELIYCVIQLNDAEMLDSGAVKQGGSVSLNQINQLTWKGHEYLDNIRDNNVWAKTKETVLSKVSSASLNIFSSVAAKIISSELGL
ncbi:DUF2513 domain-containing protein [Secundilactobacillus kimchicus]|uniref:DUF2513 domain-containing protein n=1 Tax=Secundilactobacillus kimchicus TaxID=528209 RepID=UPI0024A97DE3|nr:DUF2513 domain-containing protein [Secundilactobacillus kimchicus]